MQISLVAMDLDGTLLGDDKAVSVRNRAALLACEARGIRMVLASGRTFESIARLAQDLGLHSPIVSGNGARVDASPEGPMLLAESFARPEAELAFRILIESRVYFVCYTVGALYQNNLAYHPDEARGISKSGMRLSAELQGGCSVRVSTDERAAFRDGLNGALKFVAFSEDATALAALRARLSAESNATLSSSWYDNLEVMPHGVDKGSALRFLSAHYGIERSRIMAFGDHFNDLNMLRAAGVPVAMGNAQPELKAEARLIAPANSESGVGKILAQYVLTEA